MNKAQKIFQNKVDIVIRSKMGLAEDADAGDELWETLQALLQKSRTDWTIFWRQLTYVMRDHPDLFEDEDFEAMMSVLEGEGNSGSFYEELTPELRREWIAWIKDWRDVLKASRPENSVYEAMRATNPKYVLREWMLVDAYSTAGADDYSILNELYDLIQRPYDEGSDKEAELYYRRAPDSASARGGTAFMS